MAEGKTEDFNNISGCQWVGGVWESWVGEAHGVLRQ